LTGIHSIGIFIRSTPTPKSSSFLPGPWHLPHYSTVHGSYRLDIDWMASTITADMILNSEDPFEDIDILPNIARELLVSFPHSSPLNAVSEEVTLAEWTGKMKSWKETTSTSPSGMHLGHHKTLIKPFLLENPPPETPPELLELESH
jgi:hypothetical protein